LDGSVEEGVELALSRGGHLDPYRIEWLRLSGLAREDVPVQMVANVAERFDVQLVCARETFHRGRDLGDVFHKGNLFRSAELGQLGVGLLKEENHVPWPFLVGP